MNDVFLVEIEVNLDSTRRLTDDEITDLIEIVVDELDDMAAEPSVGTERIGSNVHITVGVALDEDEEFDALARGVALIKAAFETAGIGTAGLVVPRDLQSRVLPLQAA